MGVDGVNAIAVILIASFAVDRIVNGALFLLSFVKAWARRFPDPATVQEPESRIYAEKKCKLLYFALAVPLAVIVLAYLGDIRIMEYVGFHNTNKYLDAALTGLILVAGADRIAPLLNMKVPSSATPGRAAGPAARQIELTGKLILEDSKPH